MEPSDLGGELADVREQQAELRQGFADQCEARVALTLEVANLAQVIREVEERLATSFPVQPV